MEKLPLSLSGPLTSDSTGFLRFLEKSDIATSDIARAQNLSLNNKTSLVRALLDLGLVEEEPLLSMAARHYGIEFLYPKDLPVEDRAVSSSLGSEFLSMQQIWVGRLPEGGVQVVVHDPSQMHLAREIGFLLEEPVSVAFASRATLRAHISDTSHVETEDTLPNLKDISETDQKLGSASQRDGPVMRFVSDCITEAIERQASDIHFASTASGLSVRYRVHGLLSKRAVPNGLDPKAVFARLKVLSDMNVTERRRPQDGRFSQSVAGRKIHFRVSSIPTAYGESVVVRPLDPKSLRLGWNKLGFDDDILQGIQNILSQPNGLFLVTGPTGSGKSTTLYTALDSLNDGKRKILTVEDPVEYQLDGIDQVQVHPDIGLTFATALRSILRQDPNVIMIGEIRDRETAEIACRAALVGRLVLSTLHTNSADTAYARLVDLGVEPFVVKDVLRGVLSQELEIVLCEACGGARCEECEECEGSGAKGRRLRANLLNHTGLFS